MENTQSHSTTKEAGEAAAKDRDGGDRPKDRDRDGLLIRLTHEIRSLVEDVKEWIELRLELFQLDVEARVQSVANDILLAVLVLTLFTVALLFLALAAAFAIGEWLGSNAIGFLIVGVAFGLIATSIRSARVDLASKVGRTLNRPGQAANTTTASKSTPPVLGEGDGKRNG